MNFTQSANHKLISIYPITFLVYFKVSYNFSICLEYRILCNIKMTPGNNSDTAFNRYDNDSNDTFLLFKPKYLMLLNLYVTGKTCWFGNYIWPSKTEASNADKELVANFYDNL